MTRELISKRTRNAFREALAGWTLHQIQMEFEAAGIERDDTFESDAPGQRRSFVEQYYRTLDFTKPADVRRTLTVYESVIQRATDNLATAVFREQAEKSLEGLIATLLKDGLAYERGSIVAKTPDARTIFREPGTLSEVTRRAIVDEIKAGISWHGALTETEFLARLYDLERMSTADGRVSNLRSEIWQHRVDHSDWEDDWIFADPRIDLLNADDDAFLRFLAQMLHPVVRRDANDAKSLAAQLNEHLSADGWEIVEAGRVSGRPTFAARRRTSGAVVLPEATHAGDVLSDEYVRELAARCDSQLSSADFEGAITVSRTLLEAVLGEIELRLTGAKGDYKGDLGKQFKQATKMLRMDEQRPDLDDRFRDVIRGLVMVANGLAPLRNKMGSPAGLVGLREPFTHDVARA